MIRDLSQCVVIVTLSVLSAMAARAQYPDSIQERLEQMAADNPKIARALEEMTQNRELTTYSPAESREHMSVNVMQYHLSADGKTMLSIGMRARGTIGATLGGGVSWTDKDTGESQDLSYKARTEYSDEKGLVVIVTVTPRDGNPTTTEYPFENLAPVTVVLRKMPDGSRHMVRIVPDLEPKEQIVEYADHLTISLLSAVLIVDDELAGEFSATGSIVGITSGQIGMQFEFGLKAFSDAASIGRTDGRTIWFDFDGHSYKLHNTGPITASPSEGVLWRVYVRGQVVNAAGNGTHSTSYGSKAISEALNSLLP